MVDFGMAWCLVTVPGKAIRCVMKNEAVFGEHGLASVAVMSELTQ